MVVLVDDNSVPGAIWKPMGTHGLRGHSAARIRWYRRAKVLEAWHALHARCGPVVARNLSRGARTLVLAGADLPQPQAGPALRNPPGGRAFCSSPVGRPLAAILVMAWRSSPRGFMADLRPILAQSLHATGRRQEYAKQTRW